MIKNYFLTCKKDIHTSIGMMKVMIFMKYYVYKNTKKKMILLEKNIYYNQQIQKY